MKWGDASRFGIITRAGEPVGNLFVARKGRKVFALLFSGAYFGDAQIRELLMPRLSRLPAYRP